MFTFVWIAHLCWAAIAIAASACIAAKGFQLHLDNGKAAAFALSVLSQHPRLIVLLGGQIAVLLGLYLLFFWAIARLARPRCGDSPTAGFALRSAFYTWASALWLLLRIHAALFPRSIWAWLMEPILEHQTIVVLDIVTGFWLLLRIWRIFRSHRFTLAPYRRYLKPTLALCAVAAAGIALHAGFGSGKTQAAGPTSRLPNVIVIGLDSLRRDVALGEISQRMPALAAFRQNAFIEANVVTPLARTFPSWVTILTGEPPAVNGARDNLVAQDRVARNKSVAWTLKRLGYRTVYATDETRFSNIGREFGFDQIVSPLPGAPDFLIAQFADQPLVNLALQLPLMEYLLPSLVGNRAFAQAYRSQRFVDRLAHALGEATPEPTFLAVHLCMAHWPYYSAATAPSVEEHSAATPYERATMELDVQFRALQQMLTRRGYLNDNTLIVVLADHGEDIDPQQVEPIGVTSIGTNASLPPHALGHGSTLLSPSQWQTFLLFSGRSTLGSIPPGASTQLGSLADLAPSLLTLIGQPSNYEFPLPVVAATTHQASDSPRQRLFVEIETGFRPKGFDTVHPDGNEALRIATSSFDIRDDGRVEMKADAYREALQTKDFGVTDGENVLAVVHAGLETLLVSVDAQRQWRLYPTQRAALTHETPPLLSFACQSSPMQGMIASWCTSSR